MTSSPPEPRRLPRVAILGKPNVGKSTLFNALIGRRRAITHATPGVTRDPVEAPCVLGGRRVLLVDTGGYIEKGGEIDDLVVAKSLSTAREADLAMLVVDAGATDTEDEGFMEKLRPLSEKLILVVNKVDTPDKDAGVWNFHAYGFPCVIGVSAAHHRNLSDLGEMAAAMLPLEGTAQQAGRAPEAPEGAAAGGSADVRIAILGKPNSGKSSLLNALLGEEKSIVSDVPGTTRDVVEGRFVHKGTTFRILDTAGIRRRTRVKDSIEYYSVTRAVESVKEADVVFLLIDSVEGLSDQDKKIASHAVDKGRGIVLVLSKWDLQARGKDAERSAKEMAKFQFPVLGFAPVLSVSSKKGTGLVRLLDTAREIKSQLEIRTGTGRLNQALEQWVDHYPLPVRGKNYKIRFAAQVSTNPVRFVVFVNKLAGFPLGYSQYLENCIRKDLGFSMIPVAIEFRQNQGRGKSSNPARERASRRRPTRRHS